MKNRRANLNPIRPGNFLPCDWIEFFVGTVAFAALLGAGYFAVVCAALIMGVE